MSAVMPMREQNARRFLGIAATLGVLGVAFNLNSDDSTLPKVLAGVAVIALIWSIHRFGRLGPDAPIVLTNPEDEAAPKKKKKKKKRAESESSEPTPDEPQAS
ncbi:MAG TPA: hypothetical protein VNG33_05155 [Polyangiaceae bacterium]|nr:hypothetical protein [Polyangiaceae bacterium]